MDIKKQTFSLTQVDRSNLKSHQPFIIWFTGLSGSGKSTIANLLEIKLCQIEKHTYILDGDNIRLGVCADLGFSELDRKENLRRISHISKLFFDAGIITLVTFISPFANERTAARSLFRPHEFVEVYVKASIEAAESRDPKGLYKKARSGQIKNFTGIDSPYEIPIDPDIILDTENYSPDQCASYLFDKIGDRINRL